MDTDLGVLRERIVIQQPVTSTDDQGATVTTSWSTLATVWAAVRRISMREQLQAEAIGSHLAYEVEIRYRGDVTPKMRVAWTPYDGSAKTLEIAGVLPKRGFPDRVLLNCAEVV